jgi:hypothetical protein
MLKYLSVLVMVVVKTRSQNEKSWKLDWQIRQVSAQSKRSPNNAQLQFDNCVKPSGDYTLKLAKKVYMFWTHQTSHRMTHSGGLVTMGQNVHMRCLGFEYIIGRVTRRATVPVR